MEIFKLFGSIFIEDDDAHKKIDGIDNKGKQANTTLSNMINTAGKWGSGIASAAGVAAKAVGIAAGATVAAGTAMVGFAMKASENADEIQRLADVTGMSAERIQELKYAGSNLGVELETITGAQSKLIKSMTAAEKGTGAQADAFKQLGIHINGADGKFRDSNVVMGEAFDALNKVKNETERNSLSMQLFGKSAMALNPMLKAGSEGMNKLSQEARDMGAVMSAEKIAALDAFGDSIDALKLAFKGISGSLAAGALPAMQKVVDFAMNMSKQITEAMKTGDWNSVVAVISNGLTTALNGITAQIPKFLSLGLSIITKIIEGISQNLPQIITAAMAIVDALVKFITDNIGLLMDMGIKLIFALVDGLVNNIDKLINASIQIVLAIINGIINNIDKMISAAEKILDALVNALIDNLPLLIDASIKLILAIVNGLVNNIDKVITATEKVINALIDAIPPMIPQLLEASLKLALAIIAGLVKATPQIISAIVKIGVNLVEGLWEGILSVNDWLIKKILEWTGGITTAIKAFFGIHSPSTLMAEYGDYIAQGLAKGIEDNKDKPITATQNMMQAITSTVGKMVGTLSKSMEQSQADFDLWSKTVGLTASESEVLDRKLKMLGDEYTSQQDKVLTLTTAYQDMVKIKGEASEESKELLLNLTKEQIAEADLANTIAETNKVRATKATSYTPQTLGMTNYLSEYGKASKEAGYLAQAGYSKDQQQEYIDSYMATGGQGIHVTQNITVNSPEPLSAYETARQIKNTSQQLAVGLN